MLQPVPAVGSGSRHEDDKRSYVSSLILLTNAGGIRRKRRKIVKSERQNRRQDFHATQSGFTGAGKTSAVMPGHSYFSELRATNYENYEHPG
ncbi:hypothetical protein BaRGS_00012034 [Batillaria attramentaria]|uniref:Uncharacterized protein n=1 Tax=Batillaria attramentaria TaxID=370345 RepID=A0ABD0LB78_9CAEN